jgi:hypothetical protein
MITEHVDPQSLGADLSSVRDETTERAPPHVGVSR